MKNKSLIAFLLFTFFSVVLIISPSGATEGAIKGLNLCYLVIIPSLFPFLVCSLIIFDTKILEKVTTKTSKITTFLFSLNNLEFSVFLLSLIGGYPVGAKLIERLYENRNITKRKAEFMLSYCVNSGPSFIVIAVGLGILGSKKMGFILLFSNILTSFALAVISKFFIKPTFNKKTHLNGDFCFSQTLINSTLEACNSVINICAFVVLFSCFSGLINSVLKLNEAGKFILSLMEITNGIAYTTKNIYLISFLLGFAGICVHFQVLSSCKKIKINYFKFLFFRIIHGTLSSSITFLFLKIFKISVPTLNLNNQLYLIPSHFTTLFSMFFLVLSVLFIVSTKKTFKTI